MYIHVIFGAGILDRAEQEGNFNFNDHIYACVYV